VIKPIETSASATSYGLTTDPLVHFGILMSALIHDVEHPGVSNGQLVKEKDEMAIWYNVQQSECRGTELGCVSMGSSHANKICRSSIHDNSKSQRRGPSSTSSSELCDCYGFV
jgi:3'5'-cyclic nucleotide phosphodiesterase